jgi:hypothetical protein
MADDSIISAIIVKFYQTTRSNNRKESHFHTRRRDKLKSHYNPFLFMDLSDDIFYNKVEKKRYTDLH